MRVEVLQARHPMGHKRVGDIIEAMPGGQANDLQRRGIVRALSAPANRMMTAEPVRSAPVKKHVGRR